MNNPALEAIDAFCTNAMNEVTDLRFQESSVGPHSTPGQVMEELWSIRARMERVEELVLQMYRLKEKYRRALDISKAIYKEKWDEESHRVQTSITSRMNDYASSKERSAEIDLKLIQYTRDVRINEELYTVTNGAYYYIKTVHSGLEGLKRDLDAVIRVYQIESSVGGRR